MAYGMRDLATDLLWGYGLSGRRRQESFHNWRRSLVANCILAIFCIVVVAIAYITSEYELAMLVYYGIAFAVSILLIAYALIKRDTSWQLWFKERNAIKDSRKENLDSLHNYAKEVKEKGDGR